MSVETMNQTVGNVIKWEEDNHYSREVVTIASGENLNLGAVLGKVTSSGKYVAYDPDATDGSETAVAVLLADTDASSADTEAVAIVREAIVAEDNLVWGTGVDATAGLADLKAVGIISRDTVNGGA